VLQRLQTKPKNTKMEPTLANDQLPYGERMAVLRAQLKGRKYTRKVQNILPELSDWQIRNAVNGRTPNELVLAAVKIVIHKLDQEHAEALNLLKEAGEKVGLAA
jgi:hypothetical protein